MRTRSASALLAGRRLAPRGAALAVMVAIVLAAIVATARANEPASRDLHDSVPPYIVTLSLTPRVVNTALVSQTIAMDVHVIDSESGVAGSGGIECQFLSPSGHQLVRFDFSHGEIGRPDALIEGDAQNGLWHSEVVLPAQSEVGRWRVDYFFLADQAGNHYWLNYADMVAYGFPAEFTVTNPVQIMHLPIVMQAPPPEPTPQPTLPV